MAEGGVLMIHPKNRRKYPRVAADATVMFRPVLADDGTLNYFKGLAENVGLGGVFVVTRVMLPPGSLVELRIRFRSAGAEEKTVSARAVVRWNRRFFSPHGLGLEFVDFDGLGGEELKVWLSRIIDPDRDPI